MTGSGRSGGSGASGGGAGAAGTGKSSTDRWPELDDPKLETERKKAVRQAWEKERERVMQGKGTRAWTVSQQVELIKYGRVSGFEGQHMQSAAQYPDQAGNPDNIQFLTYEEHFYGAHGGNWSSGTNGRYDPESGKYIPWTGEGVPELPVIDLEKYSGKVDPDQAGYLDTWGRAFGYGRHEDIENSRKRVKEK